MKPYISTLWVTACFIFSIPLCYAQSKPEQTWQDVVKKYQTLLSDAEIVGSSLYLVRDGVVTSAQHYGLADKQTNSLVDKNTIFHWASITKTFTGIAIMQLRDRGLLKLDDPAVKYLPELHQVHNPYGPMDKITIRHLLSHSAGFRASTWPWGGNKDWHPYEPKEWSQLAAMLPYTNIQFEPGSKYSYSNPGIIFLGRIIELLTGENIEVYLDKNILKPLGMYQSYFDHTPYHLAKNRSNNYFLMDDELTENGRDFDTGITVSNGGLNAPLPDMVRYLNFLLDVGNSSNYGYVLKKSSLEEMSQIEHLVAKTKTIQENIGLAYFILDYQAEDGKGTRFIGHTGSQRGFQSFFYIHPASQTAAIMVMNTDVYMKGVEGNFRSRTREILFELRRAVFRYIKSL